MQMIELLEMDIKAAFTKHCVKKGRVKHCMLMKGIEDNPPTASPQPRAPKVKRESLLVMVHTYNIWEENTLDGVNSILDNLEENISEFWGKGIESLKLSRERKRTKNKCTRVTGNCGITLSCLKICLTRELPERWIGEWQQKMMEEIMAGNFQNLCKL